MNTDAMVSAWNALQNEHWLSLEYEPDNSNYYVIDIERSWSLKDGRISPEDMAIAIDVVEKSELTKNEKLLLEVFLCGTPIEDLANLFDVSVQAMYNKFKKITKKIIHIQKREF